MADYLDNAYTTDRRRLLAEQLLQESNQQPTSMFQAIAGGLRGLAGNAAMGKVQDEYAGRQKAMNEALAQVLQEPDRAKAMQLLAQQPDLVGQFGPTAVMDLLKEKPDVTSANNLVQLEDGTYAKAADAVGKRGYVKPEVEKPTELKRNYDLAVQQGFQGNLFDYQQRIAAAGRAPAQPRTPHTQAVQDENGNWNVIDLNDGAARPVNDASGAPMRGKAPPVTEFQGKQAQFAARAEQANKAFETSDVNPSRTDRWLSELPMSIGNAAIGDKTQSALQAEHEFIRTAVLRADSGAAISKGEYDSYGATFFPRPGDSKTVLAQKKQARQAAIDGLKGSAGPNALKAMGLAAQQDAAAPQGAPQAGGGIPTLSPEQAALLPSGAQFKGLDGIVRTKH